jgi:hypothetical protein
MNTESERRMTDDEMREVLLAYKQINALAHAVRHLAPPLTGLAEECHLILHSSAIAVHTVERIVQDRHAYAYDETKEALLDLLDKQMQVHELAHELMATRLRVNIAAPNLTIANNAFRAANEIRRVLGEEYPEAKVDLEP